MTAPTALVSGASVAGPALAFWLARAGWEVTVVERFGGLRDAGQNIDIRGAGREVVRRMGLEDLVKGATTGEQGTDFLGEGGEVLASFGAGDSDTEGATAEVEILRGELARILHESTEADVEYVFGDEITALDDDGERVTASFRHREARAYDVVVVAEGLTSRTRRLVLPEARMTPLGCYMAYLTIPRTDRDDDRWRWYQAGGGRAATLRPDNVGTIRATLSFLSDVRGLEDLDPGDQAHLVRSTFEGAGWEVDRILEGLDTAFYFDALGQMRLPEWSRGRTGLVGDAAYCASPMSGMGTSLAIVGAYLLAGELAGADDPRTGFRRFDERMRPYVEKAQDLPPGTPKLAHPRSRRALSVFRSAVRVAGSAPARKLGGLVGRFGSPPADEIDLPDYPVLGARATASAA